MAPPASIALAAAISNAEGHADRLILARAEQEPRISEVLPDPPPIKYTCEWYAQETRHFVNGYELPDDRRVKSKPYIALRVSGAPIASGGATVGFAARVYPGSQIKKLPPRATLVVTISEKGRAAFPDTVLYRGRARTSWQAFHAHLTRPGTIQAFVTAPRASSSWYKHYPTADGCIEEKVNLPTLSATSALTYGTTALTAPGKTSPATTAHLYERQIRNWVHPAFGGYLDDRGVFGQPDQNSHWNRLHYTQTYRLRADGDYYSGHSNEVTVTVLPRNGGRIASGDHLINGDPADEIYEIELQVAKAYCEGLRTLIQAPGQIPGLLAPEIEVFNALEADLGAATCEQDDEKLFDILDHSGQYLVDLLVAKGKDAVAESVLEPALKALMEAVTQKVPEAAKYVSAWLVDTAYDAARSAISRCRGVCSTLAAGASSIYHGLGWLASKLGLSASRFTVSQTFIARTTVVADDPRRR